jgi:hypothetical protein
MWSFRDLLVETPPVPQSNRPDQWIFKTMRSKII